MDKTLNILNDMEKIKIDLLKKINEIGINESAKILKIKQPDISLWIHGKRKWSFEKIINLYDRLKENPG